MDRLHRQRVGANRATWHSRVRGPTATRIPARLGRFSAHRAANPIFTALVAALLVHAAVTGAARDEDLPRLRSVDPKLAALIGQGAEQSPTFRRLAEGVQQSDLIVHVERHNRFRHGASGSFQLVSTRGGQRYVRIGLSSWLNTRELIVMLAHELQHANELAAAPHVLDQGGMHEFYCSIGETGPHGSDTVTARRVTRQVGAELAAHPDR